MSATTIEVVRDRLTAERAEQLLAFWAAHAALDDAEARRRLGEVVCVLLDAEDTVVGAASVFEAVVPLVGDQRFWILRTLLSGVEDRLEDVVRATHAALDAEFDPEVRGPIGLCRLIADREELARRPEAEWQDPRTFYAGYLPDGRQVRVAYFHEAKLAGRVVGA